MGAIYTIYTVCSYHSCVNLVSIGNGCYNYKSLQIVNSMPSSRDANGIADLASGHTPSSTNTISNGAHSGTLYHLSFKKKIIKKINAFDPAIPPHPH